MLFALTGGTGTLSPELTSVTVHSFKRLQEKGYFVSFQVLAVRSRPFARPAFEVVALATQAACWEGAQIT